MGRPHGWGKKEYRHYFHSLLSYLDVLITGRYIEEQKDITNNNLYRGSKNQRVIDVQASLALHKPVLKTGIPNNNF